MQYLASPLICMFVAFLATACETEATEVEASRIMPLLGSVESAPNDLPSLVAVGGRCSGVLVDKNLFLYAGHCGENIRRAMLENQDGELELQIENCRVLSVNQFSPANDIAFCRLSESTIVPPITPLQGCELAGITRGTPVIVAGYGISSADAGSLSLGPKTWASGKIHDMGEAITVELETARTCIGDSGGPVLVRYDGSWRLLGLVSAGSGAACDETPYFSAVPVAPQIAWIENTSLVDISPCFDTKGAWNPNRECGRAPTDVTTDAGVLRASTLDLANPTSPGCGGSYLDCEAKSDKPKLRIASPVRGEHYLTNGGSARIEVRAEIESSTGIAGVEISIQSPSGTTVLRDYREIGPFSFPVGDLWPGRWSLVAIVADYCGNQALEEVAFEIVDDAKPNAGQALPPKSGCAFAGPGVCRFWNILAVTFVIWHRRRGFGMLKRGRNSTGRP